MPTSYSHARHGARCDACGRLVSLDGLGTHACPAKARPPRRTAAVHACATCRAPLDARQRYRKDARCAYCKVGRRLARALELATAKAARRRACDFCGRECAAFSRAGRPVLYCGVGCGQAARNLRRAMA